MLSFKKQIHDYIIIHKDEIAETLKELIKIPSIRDEAMPGAPFGKDCANVLQHIKHLYDINEFETELDVDGGYLLAYFGEGKTSLGLFSHADVVPVNNEWTYTKPFEPIEKDGTIIGRGAVDDKSAVVISLYCAKILKELNIPFSKRLVCFTGSSEETGMQDIKNYINKHTAPDFSLVCDTAFPLYRGNKGGIRFTAVCTKPFNRIKDITASNVAGAILGKVKIKLDYDEKLYNNLKKQENDRVRVLADNNKIFVETHGVSKHSALPEDSLNAGYLFSKVLTECQYLTEDERKQMKFISDILYYYYGESLGIDNTDPVFGKLTLANDLITFKDGIIKLHFNLKFGSCVDITELKNRIIKEFSKNDWNVEFEGEAIAPYITDINNPMLQACLNTYKEFTGDINASPYINAGGTYARELPRAVEIGTTLRWQGPNDLPQGHGGAHQPDEFINIDGMLNAIELTLLMLIACDKTKEDCNL